MPTPPPPYTSAPPAPDPGNAGTFDALAYAFTQWQKNNEGPEMAAMAANVYGNTTEAAAAATTATTAASSAAASANFKGPWASLTGALAMPASVLHNNRLWMLLQPLANVTTQQPADGSAYWAEVTTSSTLPYYFAGAV